MARNVSVWRIITAGGFLSVATACSTFALYVIYLDPQAEQITDRQAELIAVTAAPAAILWTVVIDHHPDIGGRVLPDGTPDND